MTGGARTLPARQHTLHNTLQWSYDLLTTQEQRLFRRLCVFVGGFTLEGAEAVDTLCSETEMEAVSTLDVVTSLLDKSFLLLGKQEGEEPRLLMLETIREYGLEALAASGELEAARKTHALYYLALAEEAEPKLGGPQQAMWLERLEREHDNLRAALQWSLVQAEEEDAREDGRSREIALRLGGALRVFWVVHGHISEGRHFLECALAVCEGSEASVRAKALNVAGHLAIIQSDYERAEPLCKESLALYRELEDQPGIAFSLFLLGSVSWTQGDMVAARTLTEEALAIGRQIDAMELAASSLFILGLVSSSQGEYARAQLLFEEGLAIHRASGDKRDIAHSLSQLAQVLFVSLTDQAKVTLLLEECLAVSQEVGYKEGIAAYYCISGQVALSQGDFVTARSLAEKSLVIYTEMGHRHEIAKSLSVLGKVVLAT